jgi:hypothetical protein
MKQSNRVKAAMRASRKVSGYSLSFPSPWVNDILGKLDFDYVIIDGEHGPFGLDQLETSAAPPPRPPDPLHESVHRTDHAAFPIAPLSNR